MEIAERYRLIALIGSGGMGRVWRAHDELLDRDVAVKEITSPGEQERTVREARAAARLDHPNVVRIYDVVSTPGRSWIVMEYVAGRSLHEAVREDGPMEHRDAARIGASLLAALRTAHAAGVLHRDVKPHNVLIGADGRVVLTDFGLAAIWDAGDVAGGAGEKSTGLLVGSPNFVAPERIRRDFNGAAGDLWSLGATLYATVEGRPPFVRPTLTATLAAALTEDPDAPQRPGPLHAAIGGLLVRDPERRLSSDDAKTMLEAIAAEATPGRAAEATPGRAAEAASGRAVGVARVRVPRREPVDEVVRFRPAAVRPSAAAPVPGRPGAWRGMRRAQVLIATVMVLLLGAAGVGVAAAGDDRPAAMTLGRRRGDRAGRGGRLGRSSRRGGVPARASGWLAAVRRRERRGVPGSGRRPRVHRRHGRAGDVGSAGLLAGGGADRARRRVAARVRPDQHGQPDVRRRRRRLGVHLAAARWAAPAHPAGPALLPRRLDDPGAGLGRRGGRPAAHPGGPVRAVVHRYRWTDYRGRNYGEPKLIWSVWSI
nr:hypothetical protein GCM10020092_062250 [Actinoplanes digitatis]